MRVLPGLGLAVGVISGVTGWRFAAALRFHRGRIRRGSQVAPTRFGQIEFATAGSGPPVLIIHGAGGGFDQVISAASRWIDAGYYVIAPSRFGYLRSASPDDPSPENQADALADLLDHLQLESIPVVGISAGAASALQFAVRHPHRCRSLTLIVPMASVAGNALPAQGPMPEQGVIAKAIVRKVAKSDFLFWLAITLARDKMVRAILGTDQTLVAAATASERRRAYQMLCNVLPISQRAQGLLNDAGIASTPQSIALEQIKAPALVISLEDDFYRTIAAARFVASKIPGARLITYATGGHIWVGHDEELFAEVDAFIRKN